MKSKPLTGFTIIELIVVIIIIAVLAAIIVVAVSQYTSKAKEASVKAEMRGLSTLAIDYTINNGSALSFCISANTVKIANATTGMNSAYAFYCYDQQYGYATGYHTSPMPPPGDSNCSSNGWYSYTSGLNSTSGCWCVDSQGNIKDSCGSSANCVCQ